MQIRTSGGGRAAYRIEDATYDPQDDVTVLRGTIVNTLE